MISHTLLSLLALAVNYVPAGHGQHLALTTPRYRTSERISPQIACAPTNKLRLRWEGEVPRTKTYALLATRDDKSRKQSLLWAVIDIPVLQKQLVLGQPGMQLVRYSASEQGSSPYSLCDQAGKAGHQYTLTLIALDDGLSNAIGMSSSVLHKLLAKHVLAKSAMHLYVEPKVIS